MSHPADYYNKTKNIVFSVLNRDGEAAAYKMLENYRNKLPLPSWYGLKAELDFYSKNKSKYTLDPILDYGIKCDFTGNFDGVNNCRLDITTNLNFKKLEDYEPIQKKDNRKYKIVVMDKDSGEIADIFDLNFPLDKTGNGRTFEIALFMPSDGEDGVLKYDFYQQIVSIGSSQPDEDFELKTVSTDWYIEDFEYYISMLADDRNVNIGKEITSHAIMSAKTLSKSTESNIVACAQSFYEISNPSTGDGDWVTKIYWKHPVIANYLDDVIYTDIAGNI
ncbi:hypothetical protein BDD43_4536 [Mucilaginibacter gracilis]|uniref:Uncharacterized protein n=1 Tax=Mucilaginibacter gracilis TaxID=423350 RepID=A0A495J7G6_9SPHI|nr:hypothetical protein [Mucilaginibacter gracilis]RKR84304.1 hypothetical protein BDD43_4536 [Mucilaginibacter gracilis]